MPDRRTEPVAAFRERLLLAVLVLVAALRAAALLPAILPTDLVQTYPFLSGDSQDWIASGLARAGLPVRDTVRPPGLPLLLAALVHLDRLALFPLLHQVLLGATALLLFLLLRRRTGPGAAFLAACLLLLGSLALELSLSIHPDSLSGALLLAGLATLLRTERHARTFPAAGALVAAAGLTQQAALFAGPVGAAVVALRRPGIRRSGWAWTGGAVFGVVVAAWFLEKWLRFGAAGDVVTRHWGLLGFHPQNLPFLLATLLALLGAPAVVLAALGIARMARRRGEADLLVLGTLAAVVLFFGLAYGWRAERFLLVVHPLLAWTVAEGLAPLRHPARWAAGGVALLFAAWPGGPAASAPSWVLWPVPTASVAGLASGFGAVPPATAWRTSAWALAAREAATARRTPPVDPATWAAVPGRAVLLLPDGAPIEARYAAVYRLGNLLARRVTAVPARFYPPTWWGWRHASAQGEIEEWSAFAVRLPGFAPALLLAPRDTAPAPAATAAAGAPRLGAALHAIATRIGSGDPFVLAVAGSDATWAPLLPFAVESTSLFLLGPEALPAELDAGPGEELFGPLALARGKVGDRRTWIVLEAGGLGRDDPPAATPGGQSNSDEAAS